MEGTTKVSKGILFKTELPRSYVQYYAVPVCYNSSPTFDGYNHTFPDWTQLEAYLCKINLHQRERYLI